jgi:hypothetical protein
MNQLDFGVVTCRELIPDAWEIADGLGAALDELKKRADPNRRRSRTSRSARPRSCSCMARGTVRGAGRESSTR